MCVSIIESVCVCVYVWRGGVEPSHPFFGMAVINGLVNCNCALFTSWTHPSLGSPKDATSPPAPQGVLMRTELQTNRLGLMVISQNTVQTAPPPSHYTPGLGRNHL